MAGVTFVDAEATRAAGRRLGQVLRAGDLVILTGPLGAGKTTFTQGLGEGVGVRGPVTSPTFVIARVHPSLAGGADLLHVDAYRLETAGQLWDLDLDTDAAVTVVEWGRGKAEELTSQWLELTIERPDGAAPGSHGTRLQPEPESDAESHPESDTESRPESDAESRTVTWRTCGERWAEVDLAAVLSGEQR